MIALESNALVITASEVDEEAQLTVTFQRTLRVPDNDERHYLPR